MMELIDNQEDIDVVNEKDKNKTALMYLCSHGETDLVKLLLEKGADVNKKDSDGWTALYYACLCRKPLIAKILVENGAEIYYEDERGKTLKEHCYVFEDENESEDEGICWNPDNYSVSFWDLEVYYKKRWFEMTLEGQLYTACDKANIEELNSILDEHPGLNLNFLIEPPGLLSYHKKVTPLMVACEALSLGALLHFGEEPARISDRKLETVRRLVEFGADVNAQNEDGQTALHYACRSCRVYIVQYLLENGANLSICDLDMMTPLDSCLNGLGFKAECVMVLVENGACVTQDFLDTLKERYEHHAQLEESRFPQVNASRQDITNEYLICMKMFGK